MPGPDILAALVPGTKAKAGDINDKFDSVKDWGSAIPLTDLADQDPGEILIANGSGVVTGVVASGAVTISNAGVTAINHYEREQNTLSDALSINGTSWTTISNCSLTPATGTYIVVAKLRIDSDANYQARARLLFGASVIDSAQQDVQETVDISCTLTLLSIIAANGSDALSLQAVGLSLGGSPLATYGRLALIRVL